MAVQGFAQRLFHLFWNRWKNLEQVTMSGTGDYKFWPVPYFLANIDSQPSLYKIRHRWHDAVWLMYIVCCNCQRAAAIHWDVTATLVSAAAILQSLERDREHLCSAVIRASAWQVLSGSPLPLAAWLSDKHYQDRMHVGLRIILDIYSSRLLLSVDMMPECFSVSHVDLV